MFLISWEFQEFIHSFANFFASGFVEINFMELCFSFIISIVTVAGVDLPAHCDVKGQIAN